MQNQTEQEKLERAKQQEEQLEKIRLEMKQEKEQVDMEENLED